MKIILSSLFIFIMLTNLAYARSPNVNKCWRAVSADADAVEERWFMLTKIRDNGVRFYEIQYAGEWFVPQNSINGTEVHPNESNVFRSADGSIEFKFTDSTLIIHKNSMDARYNLLKVSKEKNAYSKINPSAPKMDCRAMLRTTMRPNSKLDAYTPYLNSCWEATKQTSDSRDMDRWFILSSFNGSQALLRELDLHQTGLHTADWGYVSIDGTEGIKLSPAGERQLFDKKTNTFVSFNSNTDEGSISVISRHNKNAIITYPMKRDTANRTMTRLDHSLCNKYLRQ